MPNVKTPLDLPAGQHIDVDKARVLVLGQIEVVRERLDMLKDSLVSQPLGTTTSYATYDAIGNLSLQTGVLLGYISLYRDVAVPSAQHE